MEKFYFTYGSEGHAYRGGWTEVIAENFDVAVDAFCAFHPKTDSGFVPCCSIYSEERFAKTSMSGPVGNLGAKCHEVITIVRSIQEVL